MRILLVEDERTIAEPLMAYLEKEGLTVEWVETYAHAAEAKADAFDVILLDWNLPDGRGLDLLQKWRAGSIATPVIMLTARSELVDKVLGLELGANDYLTKPFERRELLARIFVQLRGKPARQLDELLCASGIELNRVKRCASFLGAVVELTKMEFELLRFFMENKGRVFTREELLDHVWGYESYPTTRTVDTHILQLRQKFCAEAFETVRGIGYRFHD